MVQSNEIQSKLDNSRIPSHVAIIMDGNGRWAKQDWIVAWAINMALTPYTPLQSQP